MLLVGYEELVPVRQGLGLSLELGEPHPAVFAPPYERPTKGSRPQIRLFGEGHPEQDRCKIKVS